MPRNLTYDTAINVIGGLRDAEILINILREFLRQSDQPSAVNEEASQIYLRTEETKGRVERVVRKVVLKFRSDDHLELLRSFYRSNPPTRDRDLVLFWHLALNNQLFREISISVFAKAYFAGRAGLGKDDIVGYVKDFLGKNPALGLDWSETTIDRLGSKYLNLMTKLNLLSGARSKSFVPVRLSSEALTLFLYLARIHEPVTRNILKNELRPLCFIPSDELVARLKKLCRNGTFSLEFTGVALNVDPTLKFSDLPHAIYG